MPRTFASLVLALAAFVAGSAGATTLPFTEPEPLGPSPAAVYRVRAASGGVEGAVALWSTSGSSGHLFASRIAADGALRDPLGLVVAAGNIGAFDAARTSAGTVVTWRDPVAGRGHVRLLRDDGTLGPVEDYTACGDPLAVTSGDRVLISASLPCLGAPVTLTDTTGHILPLNIQTEEVNVYDAIVAAVAEPDGGFLVVALRNVVTPGTSAPHSELAGRRITHDGALGTWFTLAVRGSILTADAVFDGTNTVIVWTEPDHRPRSVTLAPGATTTAAPTVLLPDLDVVRVALDHGSGRTWLAATTPANELFVVPLTGGVPAREPLQVATGVSAFDVAAIPEGAAPVWISAATQRAFYATVGASSISSGQLLSRSAPAQFDASVATDAFGELRLAVFLEGSKVLTTSVRLDKTQTRAIELSAPGQAGAYGTALERGGNQYLAAWVETDEQFHAVRILGRRLDATGAPLDLAPFVITADATSGKPRIAFDGEQWLVVFTDTTRGGIAGVRVGADGTVRDSVPLTIARQGINPDVAWSGRVFDVIWNVSWLPTGDARDGVLQWIAGAAVDAQRGVVGPEQQLTPQYDAGTVHFAANQLGRAHITAGGGALLATWTEWHAGSADDVAHLHGVFLAHDFPLPTASPSAGRRRAARQPLASLDFGPVDTLEHVVTSFGNRFAVVTVSQSDPKTVGLTVLDPSSRGSNAAPYPDVTFDEPVTVTDAVIVAGVLTVAVDMQTSAPPYGPTYRLFWWWY